MGVNFGIWLVETCTGWWCPSRGHIGAGFCFEKAPNLGRKSVCYWLQRGATQAAVAAQLKLAAAPALAASASCSVLSQRCLLGRKTGKSPLLLSTSQLSERAHQPLAHTVEVVATDGVKAKVLCLCAARWLNFRKSAWCWYLPLSKSFVYVCCGPRSNKL